MDNYSIKLTSIDKIGYYTVQWSPFIRLDKRKIGSAVPAEAGLFQFFFYRKASLELVSTHQVYYGGLRSLFLEILDEDCPISFPNKEELRRERTYLRYSVTYSKENLRDMIYHFNGQESSQRFDKIFVEESETFKIAH